MELKQFSIVITTLLSATSWAIVVNSTETLDHEIWDWNIFHENTSWIPSITSGPTILVASNVTTIHDQNGEEVRVQLSNNNVGIGKPNIIISNIGYVYVAAFI
jgi:hypothetical protein